MWYRQTLSFTITKKALSNKKNSKLVYEIAGTTYKTDIRSVWLINVRGCGPLA